MTQTAIVKALLPHGQVAVEIRRPSACGHDCDSCGGPCASGAPLRVTVRDPLGVQLGDIVTIATSSRRVLGLAGLVYLSPLALFFIGCLIGPICGLSAEAGGLMAFALGAVPVILADRRLRRQGGPVVTIVSLTESR